MKLLWVATKPPEPAHDGGRLALRLTLQALRAAGHAITLVAPEHARPRSWLLSLPVALAKGLPATVVRHSLAEPRRAVARCLLRERFDAVVAEQLQALPQCQPALERGLPVVLRAQNVESDLWSRAAQAGGSRLTALEASRLASYEAAALKQVALTLALTRDDAARLRLLAPGARIEAVAVPFPAELPASAPALLGSPALVVLAGAAWRPNLDGARWFVESVWPAVRRAHPQACLHVFGELRGGDGVSVHAPPDDSAAAFPPGSIHVVPLRVASGVRMKVLEGWARGVPVIATPAAAAGLEARAGDELLLADDAAAFASAVARLEAEPGLQARLTANARACLRARHDPAAVAARWSELLAGLATAG